MRRTRANGARYGRTVLSALVFPLLLIAATSLSAQEASGEREQIQARITELESQLAGVSGARRGEQAAEVRRELDALRRRLQEGDFKPGDAIVLTVRGEPLLTDTFSVAPPRQLQLPGIDPIDLSGVLRGELQGHLDTELRRYLREPEFAAYALLRLGIIGEGVTRPGFYMFRYDTPVVDVFASAGGISPLAKLDDLKLQRAGQEVVGSGRLREAMAAGVELQELQVQSGDEIYLPAKGPATSTRDWVYIVSGVLGITAALIAIIG